jgi:hypothetical protein
MSSKPYELVSRKTASNERTPTAKIATTPNAMTQTPNYDQGDDDAGELEIDLTRDEARLVYLVAAELGTSFEELACEALRLGLVRHFEKN